MKIPDRAWVVDVEELVTTTTTTIVFLWRRRGRLVPSYGNSASPQSSLRVPNGAAGSPPPDLQSVPYGHAGPSGDSGWGLRGGKGCVWFLLGVGLPQRAQGALLEGSGSGEEEDGGSRNPKTAEETRFSSPPPPSSSSLLLLLFICCVML